MIYNNLQSALPDATDLRMLDDQITGFENGNHPRPGTFEHFHTSHPGKAAPGHKVRHNFCNRHGLPRHDFTVFSSFFVASQRHNYIGIAVIRATRRCTVLIAQSKDKSPLQV